MCAARTKIGTAGWSYEDWKGIVYPAGSPKNFHPLSLHSAWFDAVEINSTFYRPTSRKYSESWLRKVEGNPGFVFTAKLWQRFTHERATWPSADDIATYVDGIWPLHTAGKLGAILVQFPWSFRRNPENRRWLGRVIEAFKAFPLVVEVRHTSWNQPEFFDGLKQHNVAFCNIDQPVLDDCIAPSATATADFGYVRLHGRRYDTWFDEKAPSYERYNYLYEAGELAEWIKRIRDIENTTGRMFAITNNHYQGKAVVNALEIAAALGRPIPELPAELVKRYPRLQGLVGARN